MNTGLKLEGGFEGINPLKWNSLSEVLGGITDIALGFVGLVALIYFFFNAYRYLLNAGNADATGEAKTGMLLAVIGMAIAVGAYFFLNLLQGYFNNDLL